MPPTCSLSALWDLPVKHGIQIHTSKHGSEKGEEQHTQQVAWFVKSWKGGQKVDVFLIAFFTIMAEISGRYR